MKNKYFQPKFQPVCKFTCILHTRIIYKASIAGKMKVGQWLQQDLAMWVFDGHMKDVNPVNSTMLDSSDKVLVR